MSYGSTPPPPPPPGSGAQPPADDAGQPQSPWGAPQPPAAPTPPPGYAAPPSGGYPAAPPPAAPGYPPAPGGYSAAPMPPTPYPSGGANVGQLAQWPQRAIGYVVDYAIALPGSLLVWLGMPRTGYITVNGQTTTTSSGGSTVLFLLGIVVALGVAYWNRWMKGGQGQTVGRKVAGVKLVDANGQVLGTGKAFLRDLCHIVDSIICGLPIGWLAPLWDAKRQTWADKIMNTYVVSVPK